MGLGRPWTITRRGRSMLRTRRRRAGMPSSQMTSEERGKAGAGGGDRSAADTWLWASWACRLDGMLTGVD
jgi:hypothetical protein